MEDIFSNSFKLMLDSFVVGIPNLIKAILIFVVGYFIAKTISKLVTKLLSKIGVDKLSEKLNEIDFVNKLDIDVKASKIVGKTIYYMMILLFLAAATDVLSMPALSNLVAQTIEFIPNLLIALFILIMGLLGSDLVRKMVLTTLKSIGIPSAKIISSFVFYFLVITIFVMALGQAKINTDFLSRNLSIIIGGIVFAFALGYGLASKDVVSGLLVSMYSKDKIKVGDDIVFGDAKGKVIEMDKSSVILKTEAGRMIIPLSKLLNDKIEILD